MGNVFGDGSLTSCSEPAYLAQPQFDPLEGFPNGRKQRVMIATQDEMIAAKLKPEHRDYCAHHLLKVEQCRVENWPWVIHCSDFTHAWNNCQYDDWVMRMKEYERERRLVERQKRKQQQQAMA